MATYYTMTIYGKLICFLGEPLPGAYPSSNGETVRWSSCKWGGKVRANRGRKPKYRARWIGDVTASTIPSPDQKIGKPRGRSGRRSSRKLTSFFFFPPFFRFSWYNANHLVNPCAFEPSFSENEPRLSQHVSPHRNHVFCFTTCSRSSTDPQAATATDQSHMNNSKLWPLLYFYLFVF